MQTTDGYWNKVWNIQNVKSKVKLVRKERISQAKFNDKILKQLQAKPDFQVILQYHSKGNLFVKDKRPKEIPNSYKQDYNSNKSCSASPNITEIDCSQGCNTFIPPVAVVLIKIFSNIMVTWIFFHNFLAKFVNHLGNCFIAA